MAKLELDKILSETIMRLVSSDRERFAYYQHISYFFEIPCMFYTQGILGCLLGFWPLGQNPVGAKIMWISSLKLRTTWITCVNVNTKYVAWAVSTHQFDFIQKVYILNMAFLCLKELDIHVSNSLLQQNHAMW